MLKKIIKLFLTFLGNCLGAALAFVLWYFGNVYGNKLLYFLGELIISILLILILLLTAFLINRAICKVGKESKIYSAIYMIVSMIPYFMVIIGLYIFALMIRV